MANWVNKEEIGCLKTGDIVETKADLPIPFLKHYGIILNICEIPYISHCPARKALMESLEKFEEKRKITRVLRNENTQKLTDSDIINSYHEIVDNKFSVIFNNCEDFVRYVSKTKIGYDQRGCYAFFIVILILIIYLIVRK